MTLIEKFQSFEDFDKYFRQGVLDRLLPMNPHFYFILHSPVWCPAGMQLIKSYYDDPSSQLKEEIKNYARAGYTAFVQNSNPDAVPESAERIDISLTSVMLGADPVSDPYPMYIFPHTRAKFQDRFFSDILPGVMRHYLTVLQNAGVLNFKKTCVLVTDIPLNDAVKEELIHSGAQTMSTRDLTTMLEDLQDQINFYKGHYEKAIREQNDLHQLIDSLSEQVTTQTLTRWY